MTMVSPLLNVTIQPPSLEQRRSPAASARTFSTPGIPCAPVSPLSPLSPLMPCGPVAPTAPGRPLAPLRPAIPCTPASPWAPALLWAAFLLFFFFLAFLCLALLTAAVVPCLIVVVAAKARVAITALSSATRTMSGTTRALRSLRIRDIDSTSLSCDLGRGRRPGAFGPAFRARTWCSSAARGGACTRPRTRGRGSGELRSEIRPDEHDRAQRPHFARSASGHVRHHPQRRSSGPHRRSQSPHPGHPCPG